MVPYSNWKGYSMYIVVPDTIAVHYELDDHEIGVCHRGLPGGLSNSFIRRDENVFNARTNGNKIFPVCRVIPILQPRCFNKLFVFVTFPDSCHACTNYSHNLPIYAMIVQIPFILTNRFVIPLPIINRMKKQKLKNKKAAPGTIRFYFSGFFNLHFREKLILISIIFLIVLMCLLIFLNL